MAHDEYPCKALLVSLYTMLEELQVSGEKLVIVRGIFFFPLHRFIGGITVYTLPKCRSQTSQANDSRPAEEMNHKRRMLSKK